MSYNPAAVRDAYDAMAEREDCFEKGFSLRNEIPREFIKQYLTTTDVVLDAGGGSGLNAMIMAQRCERVTLLDISPRLLELASTNIQAAGLSDKIRLMEGDICQLDQFKDAEFSFVVCVGGVLSYVREKGRQSVGELVRVARRGATLIVGCDSKYGFVRWLLTDNNLEDALEAALEVYEANEYEAGEGALARLYTAAELTALFEEAGCEIVAIASTPTLLNGWDQSAYPADTWEKLKALELKVCTKPELLGTGHHLICVARKI